MKTRTQKIVFSAMLAALACVVTMLVKIPSPLKGYVNLGDGIVLLIGWILSPFYGFLAAGIGSALADLFSGYVIYAPVTFIIKGLMALLAYFTYKTLNNKAGNLTSRIISGIISEIIMISGYFIFEGFMYGFSASTVNIPANAFQGVAGLVIGIILIRIFNKNKISL